MRLTNNSRPKVRGGKNHRCSSSFCVALMYMVLGAVLATQVNIFRTSFVSSAGDSPETIREEIPPTAANANDFALANTESNGFFQDISEAGWKLLKERHAKVYPNIKFQLRAETSVRTYEQVRNTPIEARFFFQDHYEPEFTCPYEVRIGDLGDGGKWVCDPHRIKAKPDCLVYSVGSRGDVSFEQAVQNEIGHHCEIHTFDMIDHTAKVESIGAHFHHWGIDKENRKVKNKGWEFKTLQQTVQDLGHTGRTIDIFKIDCEGCEFETYPAFFEQGIELRQILIEVHAKYIKDQRHNLLPTPDVFDLFKRMQDEGYVLFHKEINIKWWQYGQCSEFSFLKLAPAFFNGVVPALTTK